MFPCFNPGGFATSSLVPVQSRVARSSRHFGLCQVRIASGLWSAPFPQLRGILLRPLLKGHKRNLSGLPNTHLRQRSTVKPQTSIFLSLPHFSYLINCPQKAITTDQYLIYAITVLIFPLTLLFSTNFLHFSTNFSSPSNLAFFAPNEKNNISEHIYFHENSQDQRLGHFSQSWMKTGFSQCWNFLQILEHIGQEHVTCFS